MKFTINRSIEILERTPKLLETFLSGLSDDWIMNNEGIDTWSPYDIIGHLIHGEKTDWIPRMEIILSERVDKSFIPFDRFAQFKDSKAKSLNQLLDEFVILRNQNIEKLKSSQINENDLNKTGVHPAFGPVTLSQLLAAWVVHDLNHIYQISRVMAKQYKSETGPWPAYLRILQE